MGLSKKVYILGTTTRIVISEPTSRTAAKATQRVQKIRTFCTYHSDAAMLSQPLLKIDNEYQSQLCIVWASVATCCIRVDCEASTFH